VLVLILLAPLYAVAYVEGHKYARHDKLEVGRAAIASRSADLRHAHIFGGDSIFWIVFKHLSFQWSSIALGDPQAIPSATIYFICGLDRPFYTFEHRCADELPALNGA
jgi:hypothetical protein